MGIFVIQIIVVMVSTISGHTMMAILMGTLAHPYWFASPENEWKSLFWRYIPYWFTVSDTKILRGYFYGESTFHTLDHLRAWAVSILTWFSFIFFLYLSYLCIVSILRKQWAENEKLSYPVVQLPLAMATKRRFFRSNLLWTEGSQARHPFLLRADTGRLHPPKHPQHIEFDPQSEHAFRRGGTYALIRSLQIRRWERRRGEPL
ncbi:hypothetical protein J7M22_14155 [Candidatus Poribacteria bacterium]|nr:hypothetical protein [Candidatus Poribacteria bacterium]